MEMIMARDVWGSCVRCIKNYWWLSRIGSKLKLERKPVNVLLHEEMALWKSVGKLLILSVWSNFFNNNAFEENLIWTVNRLEHPDADNITWKSFNDWKTVSFFSKSLCGYYMNIVNNHISESTELLADNNDW